MTVLTKEMITAFTERKAREMEKFIQSEIDSRFVLDVIRYRYTRTRNNVSRGGIRWSRKQHGVVSMMNLNVSYLLKRLDDQTWMFTEYKHIADRIDIGSRGPVGWQGYLVLLLAHEIAHAVEFSVGRAREDDFRKVANSVGFSAADPDTFNVKGHGFVWQWIYKQVRDEFFNKGFTPETVNVPAKRKNSMSLVTKKHRNGTIYLTADQKNVVAVVSKCYMGARVAYSSKGLIPVVMNMVLSHDMLDKVEYHNDGRKGRARVHEIYKGMT